MVCPKCGCKVTYQYDAEEPPEQGDDNLERCAACGNIFDIEESEPEDDDEPIDDATRYALGSA